MLAAVGGGGSASGPGFTARSAVEALWSRGRSALRVGGSGAPAAPGHAVAVVVIRAVLVPAAVVLVVRIPADARLRIDASERSSGLSAAPAGCSDAGRFRAAAAPWAWAADGDGGIASRDDGGAMERAEEEGGMSMDAGGGVPRLLLCLLGWALRCTNSQCAPSVEHCCPGMDLGPW